MSTLTKNIVYINDTDPAIASDVTVNIISINVIPTTTAHVVVLKDGDGNIFFEHNEDSPPIAMAKPIKVTGIVPTTLTTAKVILIIEP